MVSRATSRRSPASSRAAGTSRASSRRTTPTTRSRGACTAARGRSRWRPPSTSSRSGAPSASPPTAPSRTSSTARSAVLRAAPRSCASGGYDVLHIHEPVVPAAGLGRPLQRRRAAARGHVPHLLRELLTNGIAANVARRAPAHEPPARAHRRLRGRRVDRAALLRRALPDHPQRRAASRLGAEPVRIARRAWRCRGAERALGHGASRAADPVRRPGRRAQGPARAAARLRGAARADPRDAHARRRRAPRRSRT